MQCQSRKSQTLQVEQPEGKVPAQVVIESIRKGQGNPGKRESLQLVFQFIFSTT
jgi:hypothetical protein